MGSRAVVVCARDPAAARARFGLDGPGRGIIYTRTGRRFFDDPGLETPLLDRLAEAIDAAGLWAELDTDWLVLDAELMPWSLKARDLLTRQYAAVGAAGRAMLHAAQALLGAAAGRGVDLGSLPGDYAERLRNAERFSAAYRRYCWQVASVEDVRLAPFHLLASEGKVHADQIHVWHMERLHRLAAAGSPVLTPAPASRCAACTSASSGS